MLCDTLYFNSKRKKKIKGVKRNNLLYIVSENTRYLRGKLLQRTEKQSITVSEKEKIVMSKPVIGIDFGNYNSFTCFISDFDNENNKTKMGGIVHDLLPGGLSGEGIPSVYFYSKRIGVLCGEDATRDRAKPIKNRLRYLKRHLGDETVIDGKTVSYDTAITEVIQHCVRRANRQLEDGWQITTNLISLSYPATYSCAQRQKLIELAEKATLSDGTKVKVYGTIAEPAAAALDYLSEFAKSTAESTVLVYDLGGGTFDLALVSVYPEGRKNSEGHLYYYDILADDGLENVGGVEFDEIMYNLLSKKFNVPLKPAHKDVLRNLSEGVKKDLSSDLSANPDMFYDDEFIYADITREEFEEASRELLMKTINATQKMLNDRPAQQPDYIILTGGGSLMPMVKKELEAALPGFKEKIKYFRPSRAIAYGAARYGTVEDNTDLQTGDSIIQRRTSRDLGISFINSANGKVFVDTYIKAGTPIPYASEFDVSYARFDNQRYAEFSVYEANKLNPNEYNVSEDYTEIMSVELDHGHGVPKGTKSETRLIVDKLGVLKIEARDPNAPGKPIIDNTVELKNLSSSQ